MKLQGLTKIYCGNCDSICSVIRHPVPADPNQDSIDVGVGYHGRFGDGEDGVWFCPFCGESNRSGAPDIMRELEEEDVDPYDYDEEDVRGGY